MTIPHARKLNVSAVSPATGNELFSFCVENAEDSGSLNNFIANLDKYLPEFVFSNRTLQEHVRRQRAGLTSKQPLDFARACLQTTTAENLANSGDFGEFLLYLFAKYVIHADKIVSKIQTRANTNNTLPGRDGCFLWIAPDGSAHMLSGEAKMHADSNAALRDAQAGMNDFWASQRDFNHEILLASNSICDALTPENAEAYEAFFLEGNPKHAELKYKTVIFIGYNLAALTDLCNSRVTFAEFEDKVRQDLVRCFSNQATHIANSLHSNIYCFMPLASVDEARYAFSAHHGRII